MAGAPNRQPQVPPLWPSYVERAVSQWEWAARTDDPRVKAECRQRALYYLHVALRDWWIRLQGGKGLVEV